MITAYFLRHGETVDNVNRIIQGQKDSGLTENGIASIRNKATQLKNIVFDAVFCSPIGRARSSLDIIVDKLNLSAEVSYLNELMELDFGIHTKRSADELKEIILDHKKNRSKPYPGGESGNMLEKRVLYFINNYILADKGNCFLVITHFGVIESLLKYYFSITYKEIKENSRDIIRLSFNGKDVEYTWIK